MPRSDELAEQREQWIASVCECVLGRLSVHPALANLPADLGDNTGLVNAAVVTRIAVLAAGGASKDAIGTSLASLGIPAVPGSLSDLIDAVVRQLEDRRFGDDFGLQLHGLRAWSPETIYQLLMEFWSAQRLAVLSRRQVRLELAQRWGLQDRDQLEACLSSPPGTLWLSYPDIWATLRAVGDTRVGNLAGVAMGNRASQNALQRWSDRLPFSVSRVAHLAAIGDDLVLADQACELLRRLYDSAADVPREAVRSALQIMEEQRDQVAAVVSRLTTVERELLRERTDEEYFQQACLATSLPKWYPSGTTPSEGTVHGFWGWLPWWTINVRGDDLQQAAAAALTEGVLPLSFERIDQNQIELVCRRPRTTWPGLRASFRFDLTNPGHALELLLIGWRGGVCVDLVGPIDFEQEDPAPGIIGCIRVVAPPELRKMLTELAAKALKKFVPVDLPPRAGVSGIEQFAVELEGLSWCRFDHWSNARALLVAGFVPGASGVTAEATEPRTAMPRTTVPRPRRAPSRTQQPSVGELGFVYVAANPAIPGMLKIGFTRLLAEDRADELSTTALPFSYEVLRRVTTLRPREVERAVHRMLAAHRVTPNREHFRVNQRTAEEAIRYCQELVTGIDSWESMPFVHHLRAGMRLVLPLKANQLFVLVAYQQLLASSAEIVDVWQAHVDGDVLELFVTDDPGPVHGVDDGDPSGTEDPVPFLNRDGTVSNGHLIGRKRLTAGDRLCWLSDRGTSRCKAVVFEIDGFCQVTCRTWNPQLSPDGMPVILDTVTMAPSPAIATAIRQLLLLGQPRSWAPRNPDSADEWVMPATRKALPEEWLPQLRRRQRSQKR